MGHVRKLNHRKRILGGVLAAVMLCETVLSNPVWAHAATQDSPGVEKEEVVTVTESGDESTEDLHITSEYRLEQDMVVNNLTITAGSLDLNGYQLEVQGSIQHSYGAVRFHGGTLLCEGNYTMDDRGYLSMQDSKDTLFVNGDFTVQSDEESYQLSSGVIEIKGNFSQKTGKRKGNFVPGENLEVIFSGDKQQKIHFDSPVSYFNRVLFRNTSSEGIVTDSIVNAREMERNGVEITSPIQGNYGWTLQKDEIYKGDLVLLGDTLDLNGHTLTVSGSFFHMNGTVKVNGGNLKVENDYRIQSSANETNEYSGASAWLYMTTPQDLVEVGGDFITESAIDHMGMLRDGKMAVGGDVVQKQYYNGNFTTTSGFVLCLCGEKKQRLDMLSKLSNLEVTNVEGVELINEMNIAGNIADHGNPVSGKGVVLQSGTTFADGSFQGTLIRKSKYKLSNLTYIGGDLDNRADLELKEDLTVCGNVMNTKLIDLNGKCMEVKGNFENNGILEIYCGSLICDGDFYLQEYSGLFMDSDKDYMLVKGNFYANSKMGVSDMEGGTLELKGNFIHITPSTTGNFRAAGTHRTIFSGTSKQLVQFADRYSYLNEVELFNTSEEGVYAPNGIPCRTLNTNGNRYETDIPGDNGWTLQADEVYEGDLQLLSGKLDLNGYTLTVKGNFVQAGGSVEIHKGQLVVEGDYRIQSVREQGGENLYGASNGSLLMTEREDIVIVKGSFVMGSVHSHKDKLTNGELKIAGNVTGVGYRAYDNFSTSGNHVINLNGSARQVVSLSSPSFSSMWFANIRMKNASEEGVLLEESVPVEGKIEIDGKAPKGNFQVKETTNFENGIYNGDILVDGSQGIANLEQLEGNLTIKGKTSLNRDLTVTGVVSLEEGTLDLKGHRLTVGKEFVVQGAKAVLSGEGVLVLKGDFRQEGTETVFAVDENCKVVLDGAGLQTVRFESTSTYFYHVEITNASEEGVYAENGIPCQYLETKRKVQGQKK